MRCPPAGCPGEQWRSEPRHPGSHAAVDRRTDRDRRIDLCGRHRRPSGRRQLRDRATDRGSVSRGRVRVAGRPGSVGVLHTSGARIVCRAGARFLRGWGPACRRVRSRGRAAGRRRRRSAVPLVVPPTLLGCSTPVARDHAAPRARALRDPRRATCHRGSGVNPDFRPASHASAPRHAPGGSRGSRRRRHGAAAPAGGGPTQVGLCARSGDGVRRGAVGDRSDP